MPTARQLRRRENILEAARRLMTAHGYDGVTMRELAREGGVTTKTLYHQFGSREHLLRVAVEELFREIYRDIAAAQVDRGFDRLVHIVDSVAQTTRTHIAYAVALVRVFTDPSDDALAEIRESTYRAAVNQIVAEGDLLPWANADLVTGLICRRVNPSYFSGWYARVPWRTRTDVIKLELALVLAPFTTGYTHAAALATLERLQTLPREHL